MSGESVPNCPILGFGPFRKIHNIMNKPIKRNRNITTQDHLDTLGELLSQLRTHLTESTEKKGTYGDYLRLLEFYRETSSVRASEILVGWVDSEPEPSPQLAA
jgi:hypothetical protein